MNALSVFNTHRYILINAYHQDEKGYFFIDRDGTHFRYILNFLRTGTVCFFLCIKINDCNTIMIIIYYNTASAGNSR